MNLDVLKLIADELNTLLTGGHINKIHQPLPREIVLRVRVAGAGEQRLMMSADPQLGRLHLTKLRIPNPPRPPRFCAYLRAHFQGFIVRSASCAKDDRVVRIAGVKGKGGDAIRRDLILEILGRDSNMILLDADTGVIMDCLHRIPYRETTTRPVVPGEEYVPPPKRDSAAPAVSVGPSERSVPGIIVGARGKGRLTTGADPNTDRVFPSMNEAADALYAPRLEGLLQDGLRKEIAAPLRARIRSLERREEKIRRDISKLENLASRQYEGELLKANLHKIRRGAPSVKVLDWATGEERKVALDPSLNGPKNMERIFRKAAKGKRGDAIARERLEQTIAERAALEDLLYFVNHARDTAELETLAEEAASQVRKRERGSSASKRVEQARAPLFHEFRSPGGLSALVGKSARGNDHLLRRKASKGDLWFHVKGRPGAHVLLRKEGGAEPTDEDIIFAAALAVHFSGARGKGKAEVMTTDVKNVNKPKGAVPGQVTVSRYSTVVSDGSEVEGLDANQ